MDTAKITGFLMSHFPLTSATRWVGDLLPCLNDDQRNERRQLEKLNAIAKRFKIYTDQMIVLANLKGTVTFTVHRYHQDLYAINLNFTSIELNCDRITQTDSTHRL